MSYRIGIDIGGTFTDFALLAEADSRLVIHKQLTTPAEPARSVLSGLPILLEKSGVAMAEVDTIVHGTTLVTNAVIEQRGAVTGFLCTKGFSDVLDIARERRYDMYDLTITYPEPLVPRALRVEIDERVRADGSIDRPLDDDEVTAAVRGLVDDHGMEALAVGFINSPTNPAHEKKVAEIAAREVPDLYVSTSADVFPFLREYERWTTTTMNAFTGPMFDRYLNSLESGLAALGFAGSFYIMSSSGGTVTPDTARQYPVRMLESGPAAGVLQSAALGRQLERPDLLAYDMGGTTAKGALVRTGNPLKRYEMEVARVHEFRMGSGLPAKIPVIDLIEIGSGGGSIAELEARGTIQVGPLSAGADPGPACYGLGGERPTLSDANLVLGYLDAGFFLGGEMVLDRTAAVTAIDHGIGRPLSITAERAAWGMHESANEDVARAFRNHASERGFDYRASAMVAFGGSGPAHACRVARKLRVPVVVLPVAMGVMSAVGLLASPLSFEILKSERMALDDLTAAVLGQRFEALFDEAALHLASTGLDRTELSVVRRFDMRYRGQGYELEVTLPEGDPAALVERVPALFIEVYEQVFSKSFPTEAVEIVNWKAEVSGPAPLGTGSYTLDVGAAGDQAVKGTRSAFVPDQGAFVDCPVYDRYALNAGDGFVGPALVEERESTCVIGQGDRIEVDGHGNLIVTIAGGEDAA
ncbi:MAG TPA: hydantoinase/oxoprolinase family protein [Alphaproteobacteria bacterium]|jgi:N-methylhydantoinase A|nr:hydantoinase/oxoprolinase family protein [Alphaproteobacteria bacterium]MDP6271187.1 hydantoinase/oxoprolinase family protein [Alphaproteobacteria bacterium]HJM50580.1 hydantoinase/oxoprolinase family protein [Alphaproteobacteria bacterium]